MANIIVPKDLRRVKSKVALGLTKRQLICLAVAAVMGVPLFFLTRGFLGNTLAMVLMMLVMAPEIAFGLYEKDGMPLETVLANYLNVRRNKPGIRRKEVKDE